MPRQKQATVVPAQEAVLLTVGIPHGEKGRKALIRLGEITSRHGYRIGVTSDEAILAAADRIQIERAAAAREQAAPTDQANAERTEDQ